MDWMPMKRRNFLARMIYRALHLYKRSIIVHDAVGLTVNNMLDGMRSPDLDHRVA
jgi:hypothetical protein